MKEPPPLTEKNVLQMPDSELAIDEAVEDLAEEFLNELHAGRNPERKSWVAAHPEIATRLDRRLELVERMFYLAEEQKKAATNHTSINQQALVGTHAVSPLLCGGTNDDATQEWSYRMSETECIGRYKIHSTLGTGATAIVYRAYDPKFDREVALKVIRTDRRAVADFDERFDRDARIAAQLRHPNIVPLHETGEHKFQDLASNEQINLRYIDMELVSGETLESRLRRGPMQFQESALLIQKLAAALDYAHCQGIVHRDLKPSNVLLDDRFEPQIVDFGLARRLEGEESITAHGQILGTPAYMSPEQARGRSHAADQRSDIYSLGVIFYRMLTGRVPFEDVESTTARLYHIVHTDPSSPCYLNLSLPRDLETICLKAMAKDPSDRFQSAGNLGQELRRWLTDEPLTIRPPTLWDRARRWSRRNQLATRVSFSAAILLVLVGVTLGGYAIVQRQKAQLAIVKQITEEKSKAVIQVRALLDRARQRLQLPNTGRRTEVVEILFATAEPRRMIADDDSDEMRQLGEQLDIELRSIFAATRGVPELTPRAPVLNLPHAGRWAWPVAIHPSGRSAAIGSRHRPVQWTFEQKLASATEPSEGWNRPELVFSPDGEYLAFAPWIGGLEIWDGQVTGKLRALLPGDGPRVVAVGFDHKGTRVWSCRATGHIQSWPAPQFEPDIKSNITIASIGNDATNPIDITVAAFSSDATQLAVATHDRIVMVFASSGGLVRQLPPARTRISAIGWSPNNKLLAVGTQDGAVQLWNDDGTPSHLFSAFAVDVGSIVFSPNGAWLCAGDRDGNGKIWNAMTGEVLFLDSRAVWGFSRDGRRFVASGADAAYLVDVTPASAIRELNGHRSHIAQIAWCRDNRHLLTFDSRFDVRVWDLDFPAAITQLPPPAGSEYYDNASAAVSDDWSLVATVGGRDAIIWDVKTGLRLTDWTPLPNALGNRVVAIGPRKFVLVREEISSWRSVAYELELGADAPRRIGVIRDQVPGETNFLTSGLTPDGRFFWWVGPRDPITTRRTEVYDVVTRKRITSVRQPTQGTEFYARISASGRYLFVGQEEMRMELFDLLGQDPKRSLHQDDGTIAPNDRLTATELPHDKTRARPGLALRNWPSGRTQLEFSNRDLSIPGPQAFSPDSRFLAFGSRSGTVTLVDLAILQNEIDGFESKLRTD